MQALLLVCSLLVPCAPLLLRVRLASRRQSGWQFLVQLCVAWGLGIGLASCGVFLWLVVAGSLQRGLIVVELTLVAMCAVRFILFWSKLPRSNEVASPKDKPDRPTTCPAFLSIAFAVALVSAATTVVILFRQAPHGLWDAWGIWNYRARFLFRGGDQWSDAFSPLLARNHPDYPLLVPAAVARSWLYAAQESTLGPGLLALGFLLATVTLLFSALAALRDVSQALVAAIVLLSTPSFFEIGARLYADVPISFYFLATVVLVRLTDSNPSSSSFALLAGVATGLAAWTKNEGLLFLVAVLATRLVMVPPVAGWRTYRHEVSRFLLGLLPVGLVLLLFKVRWAPANDLLAGQRATVFLARVMESSRHAMIAKALAMQLALLGPGVVGVLLVYLALVGKRSRSPGRRGDCYALVLAVSMLIGYYTVYLVTPEELEWHLRTSADRLMVQLWPMTLFGFFLTAGSLDPGSHRPVTGASAPVEA
jgi:hypothetical protein